MAYAYDTYVTVGFLIYLLIRVPPSFVHVAMLVYCFIKRKLLGTMYRYKLLFVFRLMLKAMFLGLEVRSVPEDQIQPLDPEDPAITDQEDSNSIGISIDSGTLTDTGSSTGIETIADTGTTTDTGTPTDAETHAESIMSADTATFAEAETSADTGAPTNAVTLSADSTNTGSITCRSGDSGTHIDGRAFREEYFEVHLHNHQLSRLTSYNLVSVVIFVLSYSTYTLLRILFIEESSTCGEEGYDCFLDRQKVSADCTTVQNGTAVQMNGTDDSLECYRFTYNYIMAFGAAGGVTVFAKIIINILVVLIVTPGKIRNAQCRVFVKALYPAFCIVLLFFLIYGGVTTHRTASHLTKSQLVKMFIYSGTLQICLLVPFILMYEIYGKATKKNRDSSSTGI